MHRAQRVLRPRAPAVRRPGRDDLVVALTWLLTRGLVLGVVLGALTYPAQTDSADDITSIYLPWSRLLTDGAVPYRDFALEYPPLVVPFLLLPDDAGAAVAVFVTVALLVDLAVLLLLRRCVGAPSAAVWAVAALLLGPVWLTRIDLPLALVLVALAVAWRDRRPALVGALAVTGAGLKLWPLALLLLAVVEGRLARRRLLAGAAAAAAVVLTPLAAWGALPGLAGVVDYHLARGLQTEALAAAPLRSLDGPLGLEPDFRYGAWEVTGGAVGPVLAVTTVAAVLAGLVLLRAARWRAEPGLLVGATTLAVLATGRVGSPQYLVWGTAAVAVALPALARPRRVLASGAVLLVAAQIAFPVLFDAVVVGTPLGAGVLLVRAAALAAVTWLVLRSLPVRDTTEAAPAGTASVVPDRVSGC